MIDLGERIDAVRDVLHTGAGSAVILEFDVAPDVWPVTVDVAELETALVNLVINARDAMAGSGVVAVSARNCNIAEGPNPGDHVAITVSDSGTGIAPDLLTRRLIRSSPPSRSARARGLACHRCTALPTRPAARSK